MYPFDVQSFFAFIFIYFFRFSLVRWLLIRSIPFNVQVVRDMSNKWKVTWEPSEKHFIANMCEKSCKIYARTSKCHKTFPSIWLVETLDRVSVIFVLFFLSFLTSFFGFSCFLEKGSNDRQYIYNIFACILCCCVNFFLYWCCSSSNFKQLH